MDEQGVREVIAEAKAAETTRKIALYDAEETLRAVRNFYTGIGSRSTNKIVTRCERALVAIRELLNEIER